MSREQAPSCTTCGKPCLRKTESLKNWRVRKFCSYACAGAAGSRRKITEEQKAQIRREREAGASFRSLSERFGVGEESIKRAVHCDESVKLSDFALPAVAHGPL